MSVEEIIPAHLPTGCPLFTERMQERLNSLEEVVLENGLAGQVRELNTLVREVEFLLRVVAYGIPLTGGVLGILAGIGII